MVSLKKKKNSIAHHAPKICIPEQLITIRVKDLLLNILEAKTIGQRTECNESFY